MNIYLTAIIKSTAGNAAALKTLLLQLVSGSTKESACLQYDLHQSKADENLFIFHEIWESQEGLDLHDTQPHIKTFIEQSAALLDGPVVIHKTEMIS